MNSVKFLWAAYIATWVIHGVYLWSIVRRYERLRGRMRDLGKGKSN
jgi:CcmD family protein